MLAFTLSALFYIAVTALIFFLMKTRLPEPRAFNPAPVNLSFAQIELQAAAEPPLEVKPVPEPPPPDLSRRNEVKAEKAEVAIEPEPELSPPEPQQVVETPAQVTQKASAPSVPSIDRNALLAWVREQIEKEKYYPPAARNAGYEGTFRLLVKIGTDGKISEALVVDGKGNILLRRSLEKILAGLIDRDFGQALLNPVELPFEFEFKLN